MARKAMLPHARSAEYARARKKQMPASISPKTFLGMIRAHVTSCLQWFGCHRSAPACLAVSPLPSIIIAAALPALPIVLPSACGDTLYVSANNAIQMYDLATGASLGSFASGLNNARGLAFDTAGNLYVANGGDGTILEFTPGGSRSVFASGLNSPCGLSFDAAGNLYTTDGTKIRRFTPGGVGSVFATPLAWLGSPSTPRGLALDAAGNLYMADEWYGAIDKFTSTGAASIFGYDANVMGLAFDHAGNLYASALYGSAVVKFTPGGAKSVFAWTDLNYPGGMVFDSAGNLYVADYYGSRIEKFSPGGASTLFAVAPVSGPSFMVIRIPEPSTSAFVAFAFSTLALLRRRVN